MKILLYGVLLIMTLSCASQGNKNQGSAVHSIVLSFDDGPAEKTGMLLEVLRENQVKAVFFLVGQNIRGRPEDARRIYAEGHEIGNHSDGFASLGQRGNAAEDDIRQSLAAAQTAIGEITGNNTPYFRAPNLDYSDTLGSVARDMGMALIGTDVSSHDWEAEISTDQIIENVLNAAKDGGIILMHERHSGDLERTIRAVPVIVRELRSRGYEFVTLDDLARKKGVKFEAGKLYNTIN
jgi:peptidoglycan/xylan/chitin deacetylase (PgdA/CDA1 family)